MDIKNFSLTIMITLIAMLILLLIIVFLILKEGVCNNKVYDILIKNRRLVLVIIVMLIMSLPLLRMDDIVLIRENILIYIRELFYSVFFVALFVIFWKLMNVNMKNDPIQFNDNIIEFNTDADNLCFSGNDDELRCVISDKERGVMLENDILIENEKDNEKEKLNVT